MTLYGTAQEGQHAALVMELIPKGSLYQLLHNNESLEWEVRYRIAVDVASRLLILHGKGIMHRDLTTENVLLDNHLKAKRSDFGLSKIRSVSQLSSGRGGSVGSLRCKAPDLFNRKDPMSGQLTKGAPTEQSDIWSYSIVLWEIASRKVPYAKKHFLDASELREDLDAGGRESMPECDSSFAALIEGGWKYRSEERLTLPFMIERLQKLHHDEVWRLAEIATNTNPNPELPSAPVLFLEPQRRTPSNNLKNHSSLASKVPASGTLKTVPVHTLVSASKASSTALTLIPAPAAFSNMF